MCRHLAYVGPPVTLAALLLDPPHGLLHQSYAPADMRRSAVVNADGFGAGWYPPPAVRELAGPGVADAAPEASPHGDPGAVRRGDTVSGGAVRHGDTASGGAMRPSDVGAGGGSGSEAASGPAPSGPAPSGPAPSGPAPSGPAPEPPVQPARYRSDRPIWTDASFHALAAVTVGTAVLAAVRAASTGMPVVPTAAAPFADGPWLFSHNGMVRGWPDTLLGLAAALPVRDLVTLDAPTDAALLWALVRHRLRRGDDPADVLADTVLAVDAAAPGSRLNLLLTDGAAVWATSWTHALSVCVEPDAVTVASEPVDARPGWTPVPDRHLLVAAPDRCALRPLAASARAA